MPGSYPAAFEIIFRQVLLVIFFRPPEPGCRYDLRDDGLFVFTRSIQLFLRIFRLFLLFPIVVKDGRAILGPHVGTLAVQRRRIVHPEKDLQQVAVADHRRVERHLHDLGMAGPTGADRLVRRVGHGAPGVARNDTLDALQAPEDRVEAPKAAAGESRDFTIGRVHGAGRTSCSLEEFPGMGHRARIEPPCS